MKSFKPIINKSLVVLLLLVVFAGAKAQDNNLGGSIFISYAPFYNYEVNDVEKINGTIIRGDLTLRYNKLLFETDYQYFLMDEGNKMFSHNSLGYNIISSKQFPKTYALVSHVFSNKFPMDELIFNEEFNGFGFGALFSMDLENLIKGDASFAITYFPNEKIMYKNMQVSWDINVIGISIGGLGVRVVPDGRLYSAFTLSLRYKW
ncbi:hypothetical protein ACFLRG_02620 [Bacteroidota bacterium]